MNPNDDKAQVGGAHYKGETQHWDYVVRALDGRYLEGNLTKYVYRYRQKNGIEDLNKAGHYLSKILALYEAKEYAPIFHGSDAQQIAEKGRILMTEVLQLKGGLDYIQREFLCLAGTWRDTSDLYRMQFLLYDMSCRAGQAGAGQAGAGQAGAGQAGAGPQGRGYVDQDRQP